MIFTTNQMKLNKHYWEERYQKENIPWDIGSVSKPIKAYIDQLNNKNLKILIPGAGNAYEAEYLWQSGFFNTHVIDIASSPLDNLKQRIPDFPNDQLIESDFFYLEDKFDLIIEQTFFCALDPKLRTDYASKIFNLLKPKGKIVGLFFNFELTHDGPPFGGSKKEYIGYFSSNFIIKTLDLAHNSIQPRANKELFFIFEKKNL